jgi:hypothetical protein
MHRALQNYLERSPATDSSARLLRALVLLLVGLSVGVGAAAADIYLHRGIESGAEQPYVVQSTGRELAINVDLARYNDDQLEQIGNVLATNGYRYVRQPFSWAEIEPVDDAFVWDKYDRIVEVLSGNGIQVVAVLAGSPGWARSPDHLEFADAPPLYSADYAAFIGSFVSHYTDQVRFIQIWDLPNDRDHWGGIDALASDYVRLLAEAFNASRVANPGVKVLMAEFSPRYANGDVGADLGFVRGIYDAGGAAYFDIAAVQVDGGSSSPYDRQVRNDRESLSRAILFRELLIERGDRAKPLWMTHYGWRVSTETDVTAETQADFTVAGLKRSRAEWPWVGLMFNWALLPEPGDAEGAERSLLTTSGSVTPTFTVLGEYAAAGAGNIAATGFVPMESGPVTEAGNWTDQLLNNTPYRTTSETGASTTLQFKGTGVIALLRIGPQAGIVLATIDGVPLSGWPVQDGAALMDLSAFQAQDLPIELAGGLSDTVHTLTMTLSGTGQFTIGGLIVSREPPLLWPVVILIVIAVAIVAAGLRDVIYVIALHTKTLQRRSGVDLRPPLPQLPDWRPSRRF